MSEEEKEKKKKSYIQRVIDDEEISEEEMEAWYKELSDRSDPNFDIEDPISLASPATDHPFPIQSTFEAVEVLQPQSGSLVESLKNKWTGKPPEGFNILQPSKEESRKQRAVIAEFLNYVESLNVEGAQGLLEEKEHRDILKSNINDTEKNHRQTLLHKAVMQEGEALPMVRLLLENKARVNRLNYYGDTPLHIAVRNKSSKELINLLTTTALEESNREEKNSALKKNKAGMDPLHLAAQDLNLVAVKQLLESKADINSVTARNKDIDESIHGHKLTPLMLALASASILENMEFTLPLLLLLTNYPNQKLLSTNSYREIVEDFSQEFLAEYKKKHTGFFDKKGCESAEALHKAIVEKTQQQRTDMLSAEAVSRSVLGGVLGKR